MRFIFLLSQKKLIFRDILKEYPFTLRHQQNQLRTFVDATIKLVRDRGLDHAVEREKNLMPLINLKNFIKCEPSKSLPISVVTDNREPLKIPIRPIDFIRNFPSVFEEFFPGGIGIHPHIRLTPEILNLDAEEQLMYQSDTYKQQVADRLLKLLMISRIHKIPLRIIEHLKWDLGLPQDYLRSIIPEFPDCFRIVGDKDCAAGLEDKRVLELVCWSSELAISVMEKKVMNGGLSDEKGKPIAFPMQFSTGFEMDKKFKKWLDEWQKLPYISPYENATHLSPTSDESDKWVVAVLHEILHILAPKKTEKENILLLGEYFGLRSRFKRALLHHPGIFYLSSKIGTYTVVLREGYKRGSLIENHPVMTMRSQYVHLMNTVKEDSKTTKVEGTSTQQEPKAKDPEGIIEEDGVNSEMNDEGELFDSSDAEAEYAGNNNYDDDEEQTQRSSRRTAANCRDRTGRKMNLDIKKPFRNSQRRSSAGKVPHRTKENIQSEDSRRIEKRGKYKDVKASQQSSKSPKSRHVVNQQEKPNLVKFQSVSGY